MPEGDVGDNAAAAENGDAPVAALGEGGDAVGHIAAGADLEDVATEGIGAFFCDDDRGFWFVL